jgi:hypothetical protein
MNSNDITLPTIKRTPRAQISSPSSVYFLRYRNNVVTKLLLGPVSRSAIKEVSTKRKIYNNFSSESPHKKRIVRAKKIKFNIFQDQKIQDFYDSVIKLYD